MATRLKKALLLIAVIFTACGPRPTVTPPAPTTPPLTPTLPAVTGQPQDLIIQLEDLPSGFVMAGEEGSSGNGYSRIYLQPEALQPSSSANLVGVIANFNLAPDMATAREQFSAQPMDIATIAQDVQATMGSAGNVEVQPETVSVPGADAVAAFRVRYAIGGTPLLEYRYRLRVGNALVNLIVTATEGEEANVREQALGLVQKQVERINAARQ